MFTGIITHIGTVECLFKNQGQDLLLTIKITDKNLQRDLADGCSISCSGACLTLIKKVQKNDDFFLDFQASEETTNKTTISNWKVGQKTNVEFALRMGDELGGHMVSGHVDGISCIKSISQSDNSHIFTFEAPQNLRKFICQKGSVTINGISLTVNNVNESEFSINIIDHTFNNTNLHDLEVGSKVNLEIDLIARYLEKLNK